MLFSGNWQLPLLLSTIAGLSTCIGGIIVIIIKKPTKGLITFVLGSAVGVMICVGILDMYIPSIKEQGFFISTVCFFLGGLIFWILTKIVDAVNEKFHLLPEEDDPEKNQKQNNEIEMDEFIPSDINSQLMRKVSIANSNKSESLRNDRGTLRIALLTMVILTMHNVPEGLAVVFSTLNDFNRGVLITLAIAMHNIPEGLVIAAPHYASTGNKCQALLWTFYSGMAETLSAFIAVMFGASAMPPTYFNYIMCGIGGLMTTCSFQELIPQARTYGKTKELIYGIVVGFFFMLTSIYFLKSQDLE